MKGITMTGGNGAACADERKTQTRRLVKYPVKCPTHYISIGECDQPPIVDWCPIGKPGDVLYVREEHYVYGWWEDVEGEFTATGRQKRRFIADPNSYPIFELGCNPLRKGTELGWHKRLARFMPSYYARTFLKITEVRAMRLQDITPEDCIAEGIQSQKMRVGNIHPTLYRLYNFDKDTYTADPNASFKSLWTVINGSESWDANPWVWAITFKKIPKP